MSRPGPRMPFAQYPFGRTLPHAGAGRVPITVVTGFLGAGKTTLIKRLIESEEGAGTALIVNEFGEIGIDDGLLTREGGEEVRLLGAGCVCCAAQSELHRTLRDLYGERERGRIPRFRRVVVETSGLADPSPALQALAIDRTLAEHYALRALVVVIDAATALDAAREHPEWRKQAMLADRFVITKSDLVTGETLARLRDMLTEANPGAERVVAADAVGSPLLLAPDGARMPTSAFLVGMPAIRAEHGALFTSFALEFDSAVDWEAFSRAMDLLVALQGPNILRVKGFVQVAGRPGPVVVHHVQHLAHKPEELRTWPDGIARTRLVFITRDLDRDRVAALFNAALGLAG